MPQRVRLSNGGWYDHDRSCESAPVTRIVVMQGHDHGTRHLCEISSSFVKGMIGPEGWAEIVKGYVPGCVFEDLMG